MEKTPHQVSLEKTHPWWDIYLKAKIIQCSKHEHCQWYKDMIGTVIYVKSFGSFGMWDEQNRWLLYYDVKLMEVLVFKE